MRSLAVRVLNRANREFIQFRHQRFLGSLKGIIHVGANLAQERDEYGDLNVLWIEPIPTIFSQLGGLLADYPKQRALQYLVSDQDGQTKTLHVANNEGASSSVLDFALHRDVWPSVSFVDDIELTAYTLDTIIAREAIDLSNYDALFLDTQGSELLVLKGAARVLESVRVVRAEVADFESYKGCPRPEDIASVLKPFGFEESKRTPFAKHATGRYYDITYAKRGHFRW